MLGLLILRLGTVAECYGYDAEAHADDEIATWINNGQPVRDAATSVTRTEAAKLADWFLSDEYKFKVKL
jgi:salicylate hydroxylase